MSKPTIEVTLTADAPYSFDTSMGQRMSGAFKAGLKLTIPAEWVYETVQPVSGKIVAKEVK